MSKMFVGFADKDPSMDVRKLHHPLRYIMQTAKVSLLGILLLTIIFALNHFKLSQYFPIKSVRIYGIQRLDQKEVEELLVPLVNRGFFSVNVDHIRDRLRQLPWVANIFVRRNWPDQIEITIIEKNAIAQWNTGALLSQTGELFVPKANTYPTDLPRFVGPEGQQIVMLQYFNEINRVLMPIGVKISYLELSPYYIWKLKLQNGITLHVGHKDILTRLDHFVKVYPKIVGNRATAVDYVDLRYANGMAVRWRTAQLTKAVQSQGIEHA